MQRNSRIADFGLCQTNNTCTLNKLDLVTKSKGYVNIVDIIWDFIQDEVLSQGIP